jgi:hypothetical protein
MGVKEIQIFEEQSTKYITVQYIGKILKMSDKIQWKLIQVASWQIKIKAILYYR